MSLLADFFPDPTSPRPTIRAGECYEAGLPRHGVVGRLILIDVAWQLGLLARHHW
jgi:hypothetical protein